MQYGRLVTLRGAGIVYFPLDFGRYHLFSEFSTRATKQ